MILMQSEQDAERILALGSPKDRVHVTGNLKFDLLLLGDDSRRKEIRGRLNLPGSDILFVAGSTHKGEDEIIVECYHALKKEYPDLRLLIAPRHIERAQDIEQFIIKQGCKTERFSSLSQRPPDIIFILDTIGNLKTVYSAADMVFVGGSLVKKGGQNPIEPASLGKPIITGRFTFNFHDVIRLFLKNNACIQAGSQEELYSAIESLLKNPELRKKLGDKARETVEKNSGSAQRAIGLILSMLMPGFKL